MIAYQNNNLDDTPTPMRVLENRENFLANLVTNGLTLKSVLEVYADGKEIMYVLVQTPVELLFHIAEKLKFKLPIEENDLYEEVVLGSIFSKCFMPEDIVLKKSYRNYFNAAYSANLHYKYYISIYVFSIQIYVFTAYKFVDLVIFSLILMAI